MSFANASFRGALGTCTSPDGTSNKFFVFSVCSSIISNIEFYSVLCSSRAFCRRIRIKFVRIGQQINISENVAFQFILLRIPLCLYYIYIHMNICIISYPCTTQPIRNVWRKACSNDISYVKSVILIDQLQKHTHRIVQNTPTHSPTENTTLSHIGASNYFVYTSPIKRPQSSVNKTKTKKYCNKNVIFPTFYSVVLHILNRMTDIQNDIHIYFGLILSFVCVLLFCDLFNITLSKIAYIIVY